MMWAVPLRHPISLALIALGAVAVILAAGAGAAPARSAPAPFTYVALGDSFSSGEGVRPFLSSGAGCDRSSRAYSTWVRPPGYAKPLYAIASGAVPAGRGGVNTYGSAQSVRKVARVTWVTRACSGATTQNVLPASLGGTPQRAAGGTTQLDNAMLKSADLVTLTLGGNDVGYVEALTTCALGNCNTPAFEQQRAALIDATEPKLEAVYRAIGAKAPHARILVLGYPQLFPADATLQACPALTLFAGEQDMLRRLGVRLNAAIATAAAQSGSRVHFVPVVERFAGHEICGSKGAWLNAIVTSPSGYGLDPGSFHPNLLGQQVGYGAAVNAALARAR
jgi:lysophospholipase L1-like esterase